MGMSLQTYKKLMTAAFVNNTRHGFANWRDCGSLCRDVIDGLETARNALWDIGTCYLCNSVT